MNFISSGKQKIHNLLEEPKDQLGRWSRFLVFQIQLWPKCVKLLRQNRSWREAAALSYHTIFGIVPMAVVMIMVFQAIPSYQDLGNKVKLFVYDQLQIKNLEYTPPAKSTAAGQSEPESQQKPVVLTEKIEEVAQGFIQRANKGLITAFSGVIVVWAALALLMTIERTFNHIWHVKKGRSFLNRLINYWTLMTLGPLLLGLGIYAATSIFSRQNFHQNIISMINPLLSYLISVVFFFLLYFRLPNTQVKPGAALWGALVAALIWALAKWVFKVYVTRFIPFSQLYGILGLIPLSVLWIYITWLIVLFGLQLTYTTQHLEKLNAEELAKMQKTGDHFIVNDFAIIRIVKFITEQFQRRSAPVSAQQICSKLNLPAEFGEELLEHLVRHRILLRVEKPETGYSPATDASNISLSDITDAAVAASFVQKYEDVHGELDRIIEDYRTTLEKKTLRDVLEP